MKIYWLLLIGLLNVTISHAQQDRALIMDSVVYPGCAVLYTSLSFLGLKRDDYDLYTYTLQDADATIDTIVLGQFIDNSRRLTPVRWGKPEMRMVFLVENDQYALSRDNMIHQLGKGTRQSDSLLWQAMLEYNKTPVKDRNLYSYSCPVLSNDGQFAAVRYEYRYGYGVILLQKKKGRWDKMGNLLVGGY